MHESDGCQEIVMIFAWLNPEEPKSLGRSDLTKHAIGPVLSAEDIHPPEKWRSF